MYDLRYPKAQQILKIGSRHPNTIDSIKVLPKRGSMGIRANCNPNRVNFSSLSKAPIRCNDKIAFRTAILEGASGAKSKNSLIDKNLMSRTNGEPTPIGFLSKYRLIFRIVNLKNDKIFLNHTD